MIKYASIIVLDELDNVVTVLKNKPAWQAGRYNFPGGHVEEGEDFLTAAVRELKEETDISVESDDVSFTAEISDYENYMLHVFSVRVTSETINTQMKTMTDEPIGKMKVTDFFLSDDIVTHTKEFLDAALKETTLKINF